MYKSLKITLLMTLLIVGWAHAQSSMREFGINTGSFVYSFGYQDNMFDESGGGYVIAGEHQFTNHTNPVLVSYQTSSESIYFSKEYLINNSVESAVTVTRIKGFNGNKEGFLMTGISHPTSGTKSNFFIKTNSAGNIVWSKQYNILNDNGNSQVFQIEDILQTVDGNVIMIGHYSNSTIEVMPLVLKIDPFTGTILWQRKYNSKNQVPIKVVEDDEGDYVIIAYGTEGGLSSTIYKIDQWNGTVITHNSLYRLPGDLTLYAIEKHNSDFIIGGQFAFEGTSGEYWFAARISSDLSTIEALDGTPFTFTRYHSNQGPQAINDIFIQNNQIGFCSSARVSFGTYSPTLLTTSLNGGVISCRELLRPTTYFGQSISSNRNSFLKNGKITSCYRGWQEYNVYEHDAFNYTCDDDNYSVTQSNYELIYKEIELEVESHPFTMINTSIEAINFEMEPTEICTSCDTEPSSNPITTSTGNTYICIGNSLILQADASFSSYTWLLNGNVISSASNSNLVITEGGVYTVIMTDSYGCSTMQTITINEITDYLIQTPLTDVTYCSSKGGTPSSLGWNTNPLPLFSGSVTYSWYYNTVLQSAYTGFSIPFLGNGSYTVDVTTDCGVQQFQFDVEECCEPTLGLAINHPAGFGTMTISNDPINTSWYDQEIIEVLRSCDGGVTWTQIYYQVFTPYNAGTISVSYNPNCSYKIIQSVSSSCMQQGFTETFYAGVGFKMFISPNPAKDRVRVKLVNASEESSRIRIKSLTGRTMLETEFSSDEKSIQISHLPSGIYMVEIENDGTIITEKLIKY